MATRNFKVTECRKLRINPGGYEYGKRGQYYGTGEPVYRVCIDIEGTELVYECRASDYQDAKQQTLRHFAGRGLIDLSPKPETVRYREPAKGTAHYGLGTWIEPETLCYPSGAMNRRARCLVSTETIDNPKPTDGTETLRVIRCGLPDTFFSTRASQGTITIELINGVPCLIYTKYLKYDDRKVSG